MPAHIPSLSEAFSDVDGLYVNAEYREHQSYRFIHDAKHHHHQPLAAACQPGKDAFAIRHWTIQDIYDGTYRDRMLALAARYGMNGIQFSGDNIYWVNDSLLRYNAYVFTGQLCERCHDLGMKAYFWTHEINDFFHAFVTGGQYGFSNQLAGGTIDLSSDSGIWDVLYEKYDVFFRRLPGVDGLVLTLNECQVPVFRDDCVVSDMSAAERVARIGRTVKAACDAHNRHLILRTFCYTPEEIVNIRKGVEAIGEDLTLMIKCQPHDWQTFYPHNSLIAALAGHDLIVEFDMGHEPMGAGHLPYPDVDYLRHRFDHAVKHGVQGVAGRIDRFRNHAEGTLNWASLYAFSRMACAPSTTADVIWQEYAGADFGHAAADFIVDLGRRLFEVGTHTFFLGREWGTVHTNLLTFEKLEHPERCSRAMWDPDNEEAAATLALLQTPTPEFIAQIKASKWAARADLARLRGELDARQSIFTPDDFAYLAMMLERYAIMAEVIMTQHLVILQVRHDAALPPEKRAFGTPVSDALAHLRKLAAAHPRILNDAANEGCQVAPERLERFCRNAERHLTGNAGPQSQ